MSAEFIPTDPTTWRDFRDPSAHGFAKLDCNTTLENALLNLAIVTGVGAGILWLERAGRMTSDRIWFEAHVAPLVPFLVVVAALSMVLRLLTDNFYLVDPGRHAVYYHFSVLYLRRVSLLMTREDIAAVTVQSEQRRRRYTTWWVSRAVLVDRRGRVVPLSDWERDGLWHANNTAQDVAKQLDAPWHAGPEQGRLVVDVRNGAAAVSFEDFTWWTRRTPAEWVGIISALVMFWLLFVLRIPMR